MTNETPVGQAVHPKHALSWRILLAAFLAPWSLILYEEATNCIMYGPSCPRMYADFYTPMGLGNWVADYAGMAAPLFLGVLILNAFGRLDGLRCMVFATIFTAIAFPTEIVLVRLFDFDSIAEEIRPRYFEYSFTSWSSYVMSFSKAWVMFGLFWILSGRPWRLRAETGR